MANFEFGYTTRKDSYSTRKDSKKERSSPESIRGKRLLCERDLMRLMTQLKQGR